MIPHTFRPWPFYFYAEFIFQSLKDEAANKFGMRTIILFCQPVNHLILSI